MKNNKKVPIAILSCFLIAFVLQGILKLSGVFIFEKALGWGIFKTIDSTVWLQVLYYGITNMISMYCLSFALTSKPYSNKWYHYLIIVLGAFVITTCRTLLKTPFALEFIYDTLMYIIIPVIISLTAGKGFKLFEKKSLQNVILTITIQIMLYFCYLGLCYWSSMLNSIALVSQTSVCAPTYFLIFFEMYIGLFLIMFSMNIFISNINKGEKL